MKKLKLLLTLAVVSLCSWQSAWAEDVVVSVIMKEPNSLNTEILSQLGNDSDVKTVTHLTVTTNTGVQLGDEDWTTLKSMSALVELDLSNAKADAVPANQFSSSSSCPNLAIVKLPNGLSSIGASAFDGKKNLVTVVVPSTVTTIGSSAFSSCRNLETCDLSQCPITSIPNSCFNSCEKLKSFTIPSTVTTIGSTAFYYCSAFSSPLPAGIKSIGTYAFAYAGMDNIDIVIPEDAALSPYSNYFNNSNIKSIEFPSNYYRDGDNYTGCNSLENVTLKSPTVVELSNNAPSNASAINLYVPSHLVASYKSHPLWSKFKNVIAISPAVASYTVSANLNLSNSSMRMDGTPSILFTPNASLTISGNSAQAFNNFTASAELNSDPQRGTYSMIYNDAADVTLSGEFKQRIYNDSYSYWKFLCLPFDFTVGDVTVENGSFVIRKYDGARRNTENINSGNWTTNLTAEEVVTAGTGFILKTSESTWVTFKAKAGGTNYAFKKSSDELKISLDANNSNGSASAANTGWNMVGNPWQTYYNIHNMNYPAPFAVFNNSYNRYDTYSPEDDDYALAPLQALFVQCPSGVTSIDFPANGRQMTSEVTGKNPARNRAQSGRQLFDIQIANGEMTDKTRLVVNASATMDYEIGRDASKMFAEGSATPQIYSLDAEGTQYAINERPADNGTLKLGILFAADGEYTLSALRNEIGQVILTDHETGIKTDLQQNSYTFDAKAGSCKARFSLTFGNGTTGISTAQSAETAEKEVYTLDGIRMGNSTDDLKAGVYVIRQGQKTQKVIIK